MNVLVIIPAYNEAENIVSAVNAVASLGYEYVVVNDGSTDATLQVCRDNGINVLDLPVNLGIGGAVQAGHKYARMHGFDVDVQFDGDGQHDANCISALLEGIRQGSDLVVGSRFISAENRFKSTFLRRVGIKWLSAVIKLRTGCTVSDCTSGFRACGSKVIDLFCESYSIDYPEPESIAQAVKCGLHVSEVPVVMHERQGGTSSIKALSSFYYMVKVSLAILLSVNLKGARR